MFARLTYGAVVAVLLASSSATPPAFAEPESHRVAPDMALYAGVNPSEYEVMGGSWYAFAGPGGVTCVINNASGAYGCSGPLPGAPDGANLISAGAHGPASFTTTSEPIFASVNDARPLPANSRLTIGDVTCGTDERGTVDCVNEPEGVGFSVSDSGTVIEELPGPTDGLPSSLSQPLGSENEVGRIFTGDYCTGDLRQWSQVQNVVASGAQFSHDFQAAGHSVNVVSDTTSCGYAGRFELQPGDLVGHNERSEVADVPRPINVTRWEAFSIKFDNTYPRDGGAQYGWAITNQWAEASGLTWGFQVSPEQNGWATDGPTPPGYWSLYYSTDRTGDGPPVGGFLRLLDVPMNPGKWIDVKMQVGWFDNASGFVRVWVNGERQQLRHTAWRSSGPGDTFFGQTIWNNLSGNFYYKEGLYRQGSVGYPPAVVFHANYRSATDEASL